MNNNKVPVASGNTTSRSLRRAHTAFNAYCDTQTVTASAGVGHNTWIRISKERLKVLCVP